MTKKIIGSNTKKMDEFKREIARLIFDDIEKEMKLDSRLIPEHKIGEGKLKFIYEICLKRLKRKYGLNENNHN